jgi:N-methylhydantoinase A
VICPIYDRELLSPGHMIDGPAIIEQMDSTTVIHPKHRVQVDEYRNLIISIPPAQEA